ncbi:MAG: hypothetical protein H6658_03390 [Ardenticatenaceae bacterium]|nr:hypothetical protein [Ardenticatenaceae bacterium]
MQCPQCHTATLNYRPFCPGCGYSGSTPALERLSNLNFLLTEMGTWTLARTLLAPLEARYEAQKREVEVELGLRPPPPTAVEAQSLRTQLAHFTYLTNKISHWIGEGWLSPENGRSLRSQTQDKITTLYDQLRDAPPDNSTPSPQKQLMQQWDKLDFVRKTIEKLHSLGHLSPTHYELALAEITAQLLEIEYQSGIRPHPTPSPLAPPPSPLPPRPSAPPRPPWTWERFWDSLLSERTLKAILFLGALLLFASAVSWVASNWNTFSPLIQGTVLVSVTAVFFTLGWFVRVKQGLHESGNAIIAVASFLVPLDFLVYYLSGGFPAHSWPTVWLAASTVCLGLYLLLTVSLQAEFFGYLVALAATSLTVATMNWLNLPVDWWQAGAVGTAMALAIGSELCRRGKADWRIFAAPLGRMALATAVPVMLLGAGWGYLIQNRPAAFYVALAVSWWLGGGTLVLMVRRYRLRSLVLAAALTFPIAVFFSLDWPTVINRAYLALGWAILIPVYLTVGYWLRQHDDDETFPAYGRSVLWVGWALVALSALWPLTQPDIARFVHLWLAATMVGTAVLWQQARHLWLMSLFLMMGATMSQGSQGAAPAEVALSWTLLAVLHVAAAVWLDAKSGAKFPSVPPSSPKMGNSGELGGVWGSLPEGSSAVLFGAGWLLAGLAMLPPLLFGEQHLLVYALGNWVGVNGWLAYVANGRQHPGLQTMLHHRLLQRFPTATLFQWLTALSILPWLGLFWRNQAEWSRDYLPLAYAALAWGLLLLGTRLRRLRWAYGAPWQVTAHFGTVAAFGFGLIFYEQWVFTAVLLTAALFHFTTAHLMPRWRGLGTFLGGILLAAGWLSGLDWLGVSDQVLLPALAAMILAYMIAAKWLTDSGRVRANGLEPLIIAALMLAMVAVLWSLLNMARDWDNDLALLWVSLTYVLLGSSFLLYAWETNLAGWGHLGIWAGVLAGGLVIKAFSRGSGRSAALAALLAIGLVVAERGLLHLARTVKGGFWRRAWRLYRRPLLTSAWMVSLGTIGLALIRNLLWLGGGVTRQSWSILALFLIVGLYALSAYLYKKERFAWLATLLVVVPWALLGDLAGQADGRWAAPFYNEQWVVLSVLLLLTAASLEKWSMVNGQWSMVNYRLPPYLMAYFLVLVALGWRDGSAIGLGLGAVVWVATAVTLRRPVLMTGAALLLVGAYGRGLDALPFTVRPWWAWWPLVLAFMLLGYYLDNLWGIEPQTGQPKQLGRFPWYQPGRWPTAVWARLSRWWAMPFHLIALAVTTLVPFLTLISSFPGTYSPEEWHYVVLLGLGTAVFTYYLFRFRVRGLLLAAWVWLQFTYIITLAWLFPTPDSASVVALVFMPMTIATAAMGLLVQKLRQEPSPFASGDSWWFGWSRPFFAILSINLAFSQLYTLENDGFGILVTLLNALIIATLAVFWQTEWLLYVPLALGWLVSAQYLDWLNLPSLNMPTAFAVVAALYGIAGYGLLYGARSEGRWAKGEHSLSPLAPRPSLLALWQRPLRRTAWLISLISLLLTLSRGSTVLISLPFAIFDLPPIATTRMMDQAAMVVAVFSVLGLFYLAAAFVERRRGLGYGSVWLLFAAWSVWLLYVQQQTELQYYALPASLYLFGVAWLEWTQGSRNLASWIDRAAIVLMFGSALWQSFGPWGLAYAVLMMLEGLFLVWLGSVRRLRRLLYAGMGGVITAVLGQLIEPLFNLETYVFFILGAALLAAGILIEQRREKVLQFAQEWKLKLEDWE